MWACGCAVLGKGGLEGLGRSGGLWNGGLEGAPCNVSVCSLTVFTGVTCQVLSTQRVGVGRLCCGQLGPCCALRQGKGGRVSASPNTSTLWLNPSPKGGLMTNELCRCPCNILKFQLLLNKLLQCYSCCAAAVQPLLSLGRCELHS